jgi:hypothetical protein
MPDRLRILICGSRHWDRPDIIESQIARLPNGCTIIQGHARGADLIAARCATAHGHYVESFPAQWEAHGKAAGPIRNSQMLEAKPDETWAFSTRRPLTKGTADMCRKSRAAGLTVRVWYEDGTTEVVEP